VFNNETGEICGVICSSFETTENHQDHLTYASTLWPSLAIPINANLDDSAITPERSTVQLKLFDSVVRAIRDIQVHLARATLSLCVLDLIAPQQRQSAPLGDSLLGWGG
jgi:hypothetical protein